MKTKKTASQSKTSLALKQANHEIDRLRRAAREDRDLRFSAMDSLIWVLGIARSLTRGHASDASDAKTMLERERNAVTFAEYDAIASAAFERHGLAPKFMKCGHRDLKDYCLTLDDDDASPEPKKAKKLFDAFARAYVRKFPELTRARRKKAPVR